MSTLKPLAYAYARVSTAEQTEGTSLDSQAVAIAQFAAAQGFDLVKTFREVHTGAELWERPHLTQIRADIRARKVHAVIAYAIDRLARDVAHLAILFDEAERHGVQLLFATESIDNTPEGKLLRSVRGYVAEVEREKIRERTMRGRRQRLLNGKVGNAGPELYGYRRDRERGVRLIEPSEALTVRQIFTWIAEGVPVLSVAKRLNERGTPSPFAAKGFSRNLWSATAVHNIVTNPNYKGVAVAWRVKSKKNGSNETRPEADWIRLPDATTPAIVSAEFWTQANAGLARNSKGDTARNEKRPYLLRGHIVCAKCGLRLYPMPKQDNGKGHVYNYYRCSSVIRAARQQQSKPCGASVVPAEACEAWAWAEVEKLLREPEQVIQLLAHQGDAEGQPQPAPELQTARAVLTRIEQGRTRLLRRLRETDDDQIAALIQQELKTLNAEAQQAQVVLADLIAQQEHHRRSHAQRLRLIDYLKQVGQNLPRLDFEARRAALVALTVEVRANGRIWDMALQLPVSDHAPENSMLKLFLSNTPPNPPDTAGPKTKK